MGPGSYLPGRRRRRAAAASLRLLLLILLGEISANQAVAQARIGAPAEADMDADQRAQLDAIVKGMGGAYGPRVPLLQDPALLEAWSAQGAVLAKAPIAGRLQELVILTVGRYWHSQFEWFAHERRASEQGLAPAVIEDLRAGRTPRFQKPDEAAIWAYCQELQTTHRITDATYRAARAALGDRALVDLTGLIGHYTSVAMSLAAQELPLPPGIKPPLP